MQFDLFIDGAGTGMRNAVVAALQARDRSAMGQAIAALRRAHPGDVALPDFEALAAILTELESAGDAVEDVLQQIDTVEVRLRPVLERVLGRTAAGQWIEPVYTAMAQHALGRPFSRENANTHAAALYLRANDLPAARTATAAIPSWRRIPEPLAWMTGIALRCEAASQYWPLVAELSWIAPPLLEPTLRSYAPEPVLRRFQAFLVENDSDSDDPAWFPAWLLIEHPAHHAELRLAQSTASAPSRFAALLIDIRLGERQGVSSGLIAKRQHLRQLSPTFFDRYMAHRASTRQP